MSEPAREGVAPVAERSAAGPSGSLRLDLPLDAHLHTDLSPDSDVPIDVYAALAVEQGVDELAITDHLDMDPRAPSYAYADVAVRERVVREAAERWADRVAIRFGVEITYQRRYEADIRTHLARHPYDYTIGSVHAIVGSPYDPARLARFVDGRTLEEAVAPYFDEVLGAIRSGLFDTLGHLDYVKRWLAPFHAPAAFAAAPELYEPALLALVEEGMTLEVNTSGLRQAAHESYPAPWVTARYRELGGQRITVGSDAHRRHAFGSGLAEGYGIVSRAGFDRLRIRRGAETADVAIPARSRS